MGLASLVSWRNAQSWTFEKCHIIGELLVLLIIHIEDFTEEHLFKWGVSGFMAAAKGRLQQQSPFCIRILKQIAAHCNALCISI